MSSLSLCSVSVCLESTAAWQLIGRCDGERISRFAQVDRLPNGLTLFERFLHAGDIRDTIFLNRERISERCYAHEAGWDTVCLEEKEPQLALFTGCEIGQGQLEAPILVWDTGCRDRIVVAAAFRIRVGDNALHRNLRNDFSRQYDVLAFDISRQLRGLGPRFGFPAFDRAAEQWVRSEAQSVGECQETTLAFLP